MKPGHEKPINKTAAMIVSGGVHFEPTNGMGTASDSELPLPTRRPEWQEWSNPAWKDLSGTKFGRFTVIGIARGLKKARWVVRCACGVYSTRTTKAIRNPLNTTDSCVACRHLTYLKRNEVWRRTGKDS